MLLRLHFTNFLLHSPAVSFCGGLSFLLPPGQWEEGWIPQLLIFFRLGVSAGAFIQVTVSSKWDDLLGGECGRAAVASIVMAIGPVVDSITPTICLERLTRLDAVDQEGVWVPLTPSSAHDALDFDGLHPVLQSVSSDVLWQNHGVTGGHYTRWGAHCTNPISLFTLVLHEVQL